MGPAAIDLPAVMSLLLFLGFNYLVGFDAGRLLSGSWIVGVGVALFMPCLTLLVLALPRRKRRHDLLAD